MDVFERRSATPFGEKVETVTQEGRTLHIEVRSPTPFGADVLTAQRQADKWSWSISTGGVTGPSLSTGEGDALPRDLAEMLEPLVVVANNKSSPAEDAVAKQLTVVRALPPTPGHTAALAAVAAGACAGMRALFFSDHSVAAFAVTAGLSALGTWGWLHLRRSGRRIVLAGAPGVAAAEHWDRALAHLGPVKHRREPKQLLDAMWATLLELRDGGDDRDLASLAQAEQAAKALSESGKQPRRPTIRPR